MSFDDIKKLEEKMSWLAIIAIAYFSINLILTIKTVNRASYWFKDILKEKYGIPVTLTIIIIGLVGGLPLTLLGMRIERTN